MKQVWSFLFFRVADTYRLCYGSEAKEIDRANPNLRGVEEMVSKRRLQQVQKACLAGDLTAVQNLVTRDRLTAEHLRFDDNAALLTACQQGHLPIIKGAAALIQ